MDTFREWWANDLPVVVKLTFIVLLANAVPAITILMLLPGHTETLFVWTVNPVINARLMGVMYANALILVCIGAFQRSWARVRVVMLVIMLFSVLATVLTFFYLKPFLAHPWFHLAYWLSMYIVLFFLAPYTFVTLERRHGGRLPIQVPLDAPSRLLLGVFLVASLLCSLALLFSVSTVNQFLPWTLPPLVGGMIGVLLLTHAAAYGWALWDGDWLRVRPVFWQAPLTALLFLLLPLLHRADLKPDSGAALTLYSVLAGLAVLVGGAAIWRYRGKEQAAAYDPS